MSAIGFSDEDTKPRKKRHSKSRSTSRSRSRSRSPSPSLYEALPPAAPVATAPAPAPALPAAGLPATLSPPGEPRCINLLPYNPETMMAPDTTVVVLGPRGSGKTVFMKWLMYCMRKKLDVAAVFCPTRDTREEYHQFIPKSHVYPEYSKIRLGAIYETQRKLHEQVTQSGHGSKLNNLGIILDDCMFDKEEVKGKAIRAIMMNGRHENVFFVNAVQYVVDFPKDLRSQVGVLVVFPLSGLFLKSAYDHMLNGAFDSYEECVATFGALREHECLVFDANAKAKKRPYLFFCKANPDLPLFRVGADWWWENYYRYMVRPENKTKHLRQEISMTLAIARGDIDAPQASGKGIKPGDGMGGPAGTPLLLDPSTGPGIVVRRYPGPHDDRIPLTAGPAAGPAPGGKPARKKTPKTLAKKPKQPVLLQGMSLI